MAVRTWLMSYELRTVLSLRDEEVASGQDAMSRGREKANTASEIGPATLT